jgi:cell division protein FtsW
MAVVTGTVPNTGISLPFFSYGGSAMLMLLAEMGMILSVSRTVEKKPAKEKSANEQA